MRAHTSRRQPRDPTTSVEDEDLVIASSRGSDLVLFSFMDALIAAMRAQGLTEHEIRTVLDATLAATPTNPLNPLSPERDRLLAAARAFPKHRDHPTGRGPCKRKK